ncbi:MAG: lactate racemase domain-containing protein [Sphaerochaetaceae bacterium]|nr:lactate racemase domain-containing protein [Sphaerochaetaceae bacterium]
MSNPVYEEILHPVPVPPLYRVRQLFDDTHIQDIEGAVRREVNAFPKIDCVQGKTVAVGVGSRGISHLQLIVKTLITVLKEHGASVFIIPTMGSHGGAIAENQVSILNHFGITSEDVGVPIKSSMETVVIGETEDGVPVNMDKNAASADYTVTVARIKPHCSFRGKYESGMTKMCVIGLGKQHGADYCHFKGMAHMGENLEKIGKVFMEKSNLLFSLGLMENSLDQTCFIKPYGKETLMQEEPILLEKAKQMLPGIPFKDFDVLIIDEFGKNITGTGMDCNVIQRFTSEHMIPKPFFKRLVVLNLTDASDGNAAGFGLADVSTQKAYQKMEFEKTYPNFLTARTVIGGRIPMIMDNDYDAIRTGIKTAPDVDYERLKIVHIKNTLCLSQMEISEALLEDARENPKIQIVSSSKERMNFDAKGDLISNWKAWERENER